MFFFFFKAESPDWVVAPDCSLTGAFWLCHNMEGDSRMEPMRKNKGGLSWGLLTLSHQPTFEGTHEVPKGPTQCYETGVNSF